VSNVTRIPQALPVGASISEALDKFDAELMRVIHGAKSSGLPQGFIVALLNARALEQTQVMLN